MWHIICSPAEGLIRPWPLITVSVWALLLPLGKCILPVFMEKLSKADLTVDTNIHNNCIGILVSEVTKTLEHFDHFLPIQGLGLVLLSCPCLFRVLRLALIGVV